MSIALLIAFLAAPVLWTLILALPSGTANRHPILVARLAAAAAVPGGLAALFGAVSLLRDQGRAVALPSDGAAWLYLDALSVTMVLLISFIGWVIVRFSQRYLAGDPRQGTFIRWLSGSLASVSVLVVAGHLALLLAAWISTSLCLHRLLKFYGDRPGAVLSARKKFVFSRAADLCLVGAACLLWNHFQTLDLATLLEKARATSVNDVPPVVIAAVLLVALGAMLKSAQFPFHSWLPDTLETPTPVSALMHAGIISAGGFLLIRLSPLIVLAPAVMNLLAIVGTVTAIFGSLVMLTQTSIKKSLAFSTVAQMGYMMLQCGLGAFSLAALHLVAHSLYKAHAFLSSGSSVSGSRPPALTGTELPGTRGIRAASFVTALAGGVAVTIGTGLLFGIAPEKEPSLIVLGSVLVMALTTLLWLTLVSGRGLFLRSIAIAAGIAVAYFSLHHATGWLLAGVVPSRIPPPDAAGILTMGVILVAFLATFVLQTGLARFENAAWCRKLYVTIANRFYVNAFVNRLLLRFQPRANA